MTARELIEILVDKLYDELYENKVDYYITPWKENRDKYFMDYLDDESVVIATEGQDDDGTSCEDILIYRAAKKWLKEVQFCSDDVEE